MSASSNEFPERRRLSNVSFSSISSDVLLVKIRKMSSEVKEEDIPKMSSTFKPISGKSTDKSKNSKRSKSTLTASKTSATSQTDQVQTTTLASGSSQDPVPCLKHAAENIGRKASDIPAEKIDLCNNCSKSMLSYIFLVQDFLDSLATEIDGNETTHCLQCARQEVRNNVVTSVVKDGDLSNLRHSSDKTSRGKTHRQDSRKNEDASNVVHNITTQSVSNENRSVGEPSSSDNRSTSLQTTASYPNYSEKWTKSDSQNINHSNNQASWDLSKETSTSKDESNSNTQHLSSHHKPSEDKRIFRAPMERVQPNYDTAASSSLHGSNQNDPNNNLLVRSPTVYREGIDGIVSTLSNAEREIYDSARNRAGWESMSEPQERLGIPPGNLITSEAFVTFCKNNAEAIGCLVVGTSLLLSRTSRTLCVLVSEGVSTAFRNAFSAVFQVVQYVRSLDSLGTTKLALLEQPELGISFEKLNIWRLVQFSKCVYLNPDALVIQNCDELFCREELSAVPDIGWPDCFNSGVFVYSPSVHTFWQLLEFAEKQGSYDGGDQGLLNSYFNSWSSDISKKLSFIYNLMANVSYTYSPAFRQFGRDVKIVQFHGSFKPWHVKFFSNSGQISPSSPVHPTYVQFVHIWINIFRITVLRLLSQEIQSYAASQETINAVEMLRFFPLPSESESDFLLTPPSVRLRLAEKKLNTTTNLPVSEACRRKSAEFSTYTSPEGDVPETEYFLREEETELKSLEEPKSEVDAAIEQEKEEAGVSKEKFEESVSEADEDLDGEKAVGKKKVIDENTLPGAEVGDYQGMRAWEQGRMDYEGSDRSDNVIKRLQFLMRSNR